MQGIQRLTIAAVTCLSLHVQAQTFEVASVKRNVSGDARSGVRTLPGGRIAVINQPLRQIIRGAYGSADLEVEGGPDWIDNARWDISATAGTSNPDVPVEPMMKSLLAERFKLRAHVERRDRPVYGLTIVRPDRGLGEKIHVSPTECRPDADCGSTSARTSGVTTGTITATARTMADIATSLSPYAGRRVFDRSGLAGRFDFELSWSEEVSIFTALSEQLGLKLESQRGPVEVVVIDSVERPVED